MGRLLLLIIIFAIAAVIWSIRTGWERVRDIPREERTSLGDQTTTVFRKTARGINWLEDRWIEAKSAVRPKQDSDFFVDVDILLRAENWLNDVGVKCLSEIPSLGLPLSNALTSIAHDIAKANSMPIGDVFSVRFRNAEILNSFVLNITDMIEYARNHLNNRSGKSDLGFLAYTVALSYFYWMGQLRLTECRSGVPGHRRSAAVLASKVSDRFMVFFRSAPDDVYF